MKTLKDHIHEALKIGNKNLFSWSADRYQPKKKSELKEIINERIKDQGSNCNLNDIDVSLIEDMSWLFANYEFNGNISEWDTSNVTNMSGMFSNSKFNGDISKWNVQNVTDTWCMFESSKFNQDISNWKINKDCYTKEMFDNCPIKEEYKPKLPR